jgi:glucosamine-6-phosphate deaminase
VRLLPGGSSEEWAVKIASLFIERLKARPDLRVCLPTGLTPVPIYDRIAAAVAAGEVSFARAEVFLLDEFGGVDASDPGRCDQMLDRFLIRRIDLPRARFHCLDLAGDIDEACRAYEDAVGDRCDLSLLGIGTNGHIGMNEPGSAKDSLTRRVDLAPDTIAASARYFGHDRLPTWGVTMGLGTIRRSGEIWILASGRTKAAIVAETLHGPVTTNVPATQLRDHPSSLLIADDDALAVAARAPSGSEG